MFSTIDGAKKRANKLHKIFQRCGFEFPLHKSQYAVARAGGFRDWHDLTRSLKRQERDCDSTDFRRKLIEALPVPCHAPTLAWLNREPEDRASDPDIPPGWHRYVFPYQFATAVRHRHSPAIKRGSGPGQNLRENMGSGVLINIHGGRNPYPRLEPDTLAFIFHGSPEMIFGIDSQHSRFAQELQTLQDAGVIELRRNQVVILSPDRDEIHSRVLDSQIDKARHWMSEPGNMKEKADALRNALAVIGIEDALRRSETLLQYGSDSYVHRSGPIQDILSDIAGAGEVLAFARFYEFAATIWPHDARRLRDLVPAKILNQYFAGYLGFAGSPPLFKFTNDNPKWAESLKSTLSDPVKFEQTVQRMTEAIELAA